MEEMINAYTVLVGKPEESRALGRPGYRWKDNIRMAGKWGEEVWTEFM
jgi:hypothetical protein